MQAQDMRQMLERVLNLALSYLLATMSCAENTDSLIQAESSKPINQKIPIYSAYTENNAYSEVARRIAIFKRVISVFTKEES